MVRLKAVERLSETRLYSYKFNAFGREKKLPVNL